MQTFDRREFAALLPALLVGGTKTAEAQSPASQITGSAASGEPSPLKRIRSGVYPPGAERGTPGQRMSRSYLTGMLITGNIRLEMHETTQEAGAPHEAIGNHLHNELWLVREGTVELTTNGITNKMVAGDVGICVAGDMHFIANTGSSRATYFVVTVGPPE